MRNEDKSTDRDKKSLVVVGADTVVAVEVGEGEGEAIYEKPKSREDAVEKLRRLSGREHSVHTGVCIVDQKGEKTIFHESTKVGK